MKSEGNGRIESWNCWSRIELQASKATVIDDITTRSLQGYESWLSATLDEDPPRPPPDQLAEKHQPSASTSASQHARIPSVTQGNANGHLLHPPLTISVTADLWNLACMRLRTEDADLVQEYHRVSWQIFENTFVNLTRVTVHRP
jgi:hypothetical protein